MVLDRWRPSRGLIPWQPFRAMEEMERRFDEMFGRGFLPSVWRRLPLEERVWAPALDIFEKDDKFVVKAELPGMEEKDIDVSVVGDMLTIKGEKKSETEVKEEDYYCCEHSYGNFYRSISLPSTVDATKIEANYEDGILEVSLPKAPEVKPKKIAISAKKVIPARKATSAKKKEKVSK
jgi:HSP20 family protein